MQSTSVLKFPDQHTRLLHEQLSLITEFSALRLKRLNLFSSGIQSLNAQDLLAGNLTKTYCTTSPLPRAPHRSRSLHRAADRSVQDGHLLSNLKSKSFVAARIKAISLNLPTLEQLQQQEGQLPQQKERRSISGSAANSYERSRSAAEPAQIRPPTRHKSKHTHGNRVNLSNF